MENINSRTPFRGELRYGEPMALHTTFKVGGPADVWVRPDGPWFSSYGASLLEAAAGGGIPVFILGGGANLVVSDRGIRGIVLDMGGYRGGEPRGSAPGEGKLAFRAGTPVDEASESAAAAGLSGLEFLAGMPGTIGGAVWMNARCYGREIGDLLIETEILDETLLPVKVPRDGGAWGYKQSPFRDRKVLISAASFSLTPGDEGAIGAKMREHRRNREEKGHYRAPSAGSAFKNNRDFGAPTGKIVDELGLRGFSVGGAQIAPWHGNIIINRGGARAADIRTLVEETAARVRARRGLVLEPELLFVGDWRKGEPGF
jgi:UDP-N-acetylmuramate dehydrogenase